MGYTSYSSDNRHFRVSSMSAEKSFLSAKTDDIFEQNKVQKAHESMDPKKALLREARDSAAHPNTVPIILGLDVTGSMRQIPRHLIKSGLPTMIGTIIQRGIPDPALLFLAIGDSTCDHYPFQVAQFESGDAELDMWLTRTFLEGRGGNNAGESYLWAWYYAANHTVTDAWEKRKEKGFLFTIGDEPCLPTITTSEMTEIMGITKQQSYSDKELLAAAQEKWNVYHIHITETTTGKSPRVAAYWNDLLGQQCIAVDDHKKVDSVIAEIVADSIVGKPAAPTTKEKPATETPYL